MHKTFFGVVVIAILLSLAACELIGSKPETEPAEIKSASSSSSGSKSETDAEPATSAEPAASAGPATSAKPATSAEPAVVAVPAAAPKPTATLARPDNREAALAAHKLALQKRGIDLSDDDVGYYMDTHEARFIQLVRDDRVSVQRQGNNLALIISGGDSFTSNSARLRPEIDGVLNAIAQVLEEYRDTRIIISGHTDDAGEADYNQQLAEWRGRAVSRF
ncbi:MAG: OmpA family protein, partial [Gammaproteobacteria bacterium]|nr:OmpA family protein [Gammaproteobacteria bacterium]